MSVRRDNFNAFCSIVAAGMDALAAFAALHLAVWIRFDADLIPLLGDVMPPRAMYSAAALALAPLLLVVFRSIGLYERPQLGSFADKLPKIVRGVAITFAAALALSFVVRVEGWPPYSRYVAAIAAVTTLGIISIERFFLFRIERHFAKHSTAKRKFLVIGTDAAAAAVRRNLEGEPRLRARVIGFLSLGPFPSVDPAVPSDLVLGTLGDLEKIADATAADEIILADPSLPRDRLMDLFFLCERRILPFSMVPDLYGILTSRVRIRQIADTPLLGLAPWPLESFWNRFLKRAEDICGAVVGLVLSAPVLLVCAPLVKRSSPGPVFYSQVRCGIDGRLFTIYKLRSMPTNAEAASGPVWTTADDARRTPFGSFLRKWNIDELPQFWNVLRGDMSLVGPRPERPHFVEQFKVNVGHYMSRHLSRPGMTGWAQVNGLRGNTSIEDRVKHDIWYLEHWSLSLDLKILVQTFFNNSNAY